MGCNVRAVVAALALLPLLAGLGGCVGLVYPVDVSYGDTRLQKTAETTEEPVVLYGNQPFAPVTPMLAEGDAYVLKPPPADLAASPLYARVATKVEGRRILVKEVRRECSGVRVRFYCGTIHPQASVLWWLQLPLTVFFDIVEPVWSITVRLIFLPFRCIDGEEEEVLTGASLEPWPRAILRDPANRLRYDLGPQPPEGYRLDLRQLADRDFKAPVIVFAGEDGKLRHDETLPEPVAKELDALVKKGAAGR